VKILDRYILTTYLKTFLSVLVILMLIFILQSVWLYITELAGKDLAPQVILKFLIYATPTLVPLILPLTILLSSIMVFGSFAENYEFAAMKSTGISLQRAMRPLSIFIVFLAIFSFYFANHAIPWANYNFYNLRKNIAKTLPAMAIAEGQFNEIGDYNIKVNEKSGEKGEQLKQVYIHKKVSSRTGNYTVITSNTGELISNEDSNLLQLKLYNGYYYDEIFNKNPKQNIKKPHVRSYFDEYIINVDLEGLNDVDYDDKSHEGRYNMLNTSELKYTIDSLNRQHNDEYKRFSKTLYGRTSFETMKEDLKLKKDSTYMGETLDLFNLNTKIQVTNLALNTAKSTSQVIKSKINSFEKSTIWKNKHIQSLHEKYALGFACIILFFVGAPLGALIKKGGIGLPMVIAILLFLSYHFIGIFAKNSSKDGSIDPIFATWLSTLIMLPLSIYLTSRATKDRPLFEVGTILEPLKKLFKIKSEKFIKNDETLPKDSEAYKTLESYNNNQLIHVVKNFRSYNQGLLYRNSAMAILNSRGLTAEELKMSGKLDSNQYMEGIRLRNQYAEDSKLALILYLIGAIPIILGLILRNNSFPGIGTILLVFGIIIFILFISALVKSYSRHTNLYRHLGKSNGLHALLFTLVGLPLYVVFYYIQRKQLDSQLHVKTINDKSDTDKASEELSTKTLSVLKDYKDYSTTSLVSYFIGAALLILHFVFNNNKLPELAYSVLHLSLIAFIFYSIYAIVSFYVLKTLGKTLKLEKPFSLHLIGLGFIVYPIVYYIIRKQISEELYYSNKKP